jgi:hypothetical protein
MQAAILKERNHIVLDKCLNCGIAEAERPLLVLRYQGMATAICPQCLPILIHHPEKLTAKLREISAKQQS